MDSTNCTVAISKMEIQERHAKYAGILTTLIIPFFSTYRNDEFLKLFWGFDVHKDTILAQRNKFLHTWSTQVEVKCFYLNTAKWNYLNL